MFLQSLDLFSNDLQPFRGRLILRIQLQRLLVMLRGIFQILQRVLVRFPQVGAVFQGPAEIVTALLLQPWRSIDQRLAECLQRFVVVTQLVGSHAGIELHFGHIGRINVVLQILLKLCVSVLVLPLII